MEKNILLTSAAANMIWQFNKNNMIILRDLGFKVTVATNFANPGTITKKEVVKFQEWMSERGITWHQVDFKRGVGSPLANIKAIRQIRNIIKLNNISVVHSQSPIGGVLSRIAGLGCNVKNIYTAHGFHFFNGAPLKNWMLFYPIEYLLSYITNTLILINDEDYLRAEHHFHARNLLKIPGVGINVADALAVSAATKKKRRQITRNKLHLADNDIMLLNIGEINKNKNQALIIKAIAKLNNANVHLFIAGIGEEKEKLEQLSDSLSVEKQVHFLGFRHDLADLHYAADANVFPSHREGLALSGLESIADGLYLLGSNIRGIRDYITDSSVGDTFDPDDVDDLCGKLRLLIINRPTVPTSEVRNLLKYDVNEVNKAMRTMYSNYL